MARQNNIPPRGADAHLRQPNVAHDPSAPAQGYGNAFPHQYGGQDHGGQQPHAGSSQRDIFNALRPDPPSLGSRFEPFAAPAGRPQGQAGAPHVQSHSGHQGGHQAGYGRQPFGEPEADPYAAPAFGGQTHDPYGRPLPGGYPAQGGYGGAEQHDQAYYSQQPQYGHAPQGQYGHEEGYAYDDPYRPQAGDPYAGQHAAGHEGDGAYYDDEYADEPEGKRSRGPRAIVVIGALIGAIVLGGGLAYGYKAMTGGGRESGKLPVLRADSAPTKAEPTDPGGRQMAHTDKKFLNRLTEDRAQPRPVPVSIQPPPPEREAADGPRRVPTLVVNRDGSIGQSSAPPPPAGPQASGVPGLLVDGLGGRAPAPQREAAVQPLPPPAPPAPSARAMSVEAPAPTSPPRRVASAPTVATVEPTPAPIAPAPEARRPVPTPTQRQAARTPPPAAVPAATPSGATSSGWVAVIASRQSHMDALKSLADIQQRYPGVLQGRAADVREANLGDKGMWYRAVVGPPTSREAASSVCGALTKQGYSGCWVTPY